MLGVALLFLPELQAALHDPTIIHGAVLALAATYVASLGNMAASRKHAGRAAGGDGQRLWTRVRHRRACADRDDPGHPDRVRSARAVRALVLLNLSLAGTALAFGLYLALIQRIGASRAADASVLFPVVALAVSTLFKGYAWSLPAIVGLLVLVAGNALALGGAARARQ